MNLVPIRLLTWVTLAAALLSAILLAGGDAGLPDLTGYVVGARPR